MTTTPFAKALAAQLTARGTTQAELVDALGASQSSVSQWVNGRYVPDPETVFRIEEALGLRPGALSQHLGYVPVGAKPNVTVLDCIASAPELSVWQRDALAAVYATFLTKQPVGAGRRRSA